MPEDTTQPTIKADAVTGEIVLQPVSAAGALTALSDYENIVAKLDLLRADWQQARASVIPAPVMSELADIDAEFLPNIAAAEKVAEIAKKLLQEAGKYVGRTVAGQAYDIVYKRASWRIKDAEGLLAYAVLHPEVMRYIERGQPSAAVTPKKAKG